MCLHIVFQTFVARLPPPNLAGVKNLKVMTKEDKFTIRPEPDQTATAEDVVGQHRPKDKPDMISTQVFEDFLPPKVSVVEVFFVVLLY